MNDDTPTTPPQANATASSALLERRKKLEFELEDIADARNGYRARIEHLDLRESKIVAEIELVEQGIGVLAEAGL